MNEHRIALLGAGSWGTAIAIHLAKAGNTVFLWGHNPKHIAQLQQQRTNQRYLPGIPFPDSLHPISDLTQCQEKATDVILAVPSHAFEALIKQLEPPVSGISWLTKGLNPADNQLLSQVVARYWGDHFPTAIISGPSFAAEVAKGLPTALTLASNNSFYQKKLQRLFHYDNLRTYLSHDLIGVQLCGTVKNVIAIACGISDGLGYGANARAALITRGLVELRRLGLALGAQEKTFQGLAGLGDMVLTCTDNQSRNRRFGLLLGQGHAAAEAEKSIGQVVEGKHNARQVCELSESLQIEMPICTQVFLLLENSITPQDAVVNLMSRAADVE
jgi:glycerol-3-phosphate dehydrogenase (NAD(P)+)